MGIDYISIRASIEPIYSPNEDEPFLWNDLWFKPVYLKLKEVAIKGFESQYKGLRIVADDTEITVTNSLHKFYHGNNYTDFSISQLKNVILEICNKLKIEASRWKILKMEFGFNLVMPKAATEYLDCFLFYKHRVFEPMRDNQTIYGKKCFLSEYTVKVYDKKFQTNLNNRNLLKKEMLRLEVAYTKRRKLPPGIQTLADLEDSNKIRLLYDEFRDIFQDIIYGGKVDFTNSTSEQRMLYYASLSPKFLEVEKRLNKEHIKSLKAEIKAVKERFSTKGLKQTLLKALSDKYIELFCS